MTQEKQEKSTSERLSELIGQLSRDQLRYIVALQEYPTKKEAAEAISMKPNTIYKWPAIVEEAAYLMAVEATDSALAIRRKNLVKAMAVKVAGLDSDDEQVRQKSATEIIEGELGKPGQKIDMNSDGKVEIVVRYEDDDHPTEAP